MKLQMNHNDISARAQGDLIRACIHEAAHLITAFQLGVAGKFDVWACEPETTEEAISQSWFTGRCTIYGQLPTPEARTLWGLAGNLAEMVHENPSAENWQILETFDESTYSPEEVISATDLSAIGDLDHAWRNGLVEKALSMVVANWPDILQEAELYAQDEAAQDEAHQIAKAVSRLFSVQEGQP